MVISYLALLEKRYKGQLDDRAREYIDIAVGGGERMKALINDLLEYSRIETQIRPFVPVDMNEVVSRALKNLEVPIPENKAKIIVDELPMIMADEIQMTQVMQNLVSNALKYRGKENPEDHISSNEAAKEYIISVGLQDNGIGLNMEYAD